MELYLQHGEREFEWLKEYNYRGDLIQLTRRNYLRGMGCCITYHSPYKLTKKAVKYIKNLDNP